MKAVAVAAELADALALVGRACGAGVLSMVRLDLGPGAFELCATDLSLTLSARGKAEVVEPGRVLLPSPRTLADALRSLGSDPLEIEAEGKSVRLCCGRWRSELSTVPVEEFPLLDLEVPARGPVPASAVGEALQRVTPAASSDPARPVLCGVLLESVEGGTRMVATDSYRLAVTEVDVPPPAERALVPARAMAEIARLCDRGDGMAWTWDGSKLVASAGPATVAVTGIAGEFPDYRRFLEVPEGGCRASVDGEALSRAVRRVALVSQSSRFGRVVRCEFAADRVVVEASGDDGHARESVPVDGDAEMTVAFNAQFVLDALAAVGPGMVDLVLVDADKPAVFCPGGPTTVVLMPVRLA
ncbi:MAG: DNA polymerase III subunit beta [Actinomycetota bacterium]|nr:MAG: DNA polymerase III subunit beta [Actinomycetota bacterium]